MSSQSNPYDTDATSARPAFPMRTPRPMYWSIRREVWENRSVWMAPLIVAAVVMFATMLGSFALPKKVRNVAGLDAAKLHASIVKPYSLAPAPIMLATFIVGVFYCLDALYGERRERSILFWKSLPVSDRTTVLSKASIPLVVLPAIALVLSVIVFFALLVQGTVWLAVNGVSPARLWAEVHFVEEPITMLYGLVVHSLWFAPIYGWLLLVSAWAKRAPVLWALLPFLAISALEKMAFNTMTFMQMLEYRVGGAMKEAFSFRQSHLAGEFLSELHPVRFLSAPGLWVGLLFAAACIAGAVRLRRSRQPI